MIRRTRFRDERIDRRRHGEVRLARARGADADDDVVLGDLLEVLRLAAASWA